MDEIESNGWNLNISRYVSTAQAEDEIDLDAIHAELVTIEATIQEARKRHNGFLEELGLKPLPGGKGDVE
jgi:type I restriction enzyme M protein